MVVEGGGAAVGQGWFRVVFHKRDAGGGGGQSPLDNKLVGGSKSYSHGLTNNTFKCFGVFFLLHMNFSGLCASFYIYRSIHNILNNFEFSTFSNPKSSTGPKLSWVFPT